MVKSTGLGAGLFVDGYDLSGDTGEANTLRTSRAVTPLTGIDKSAMERGHTHRDGEIGWSSWWNPSAAQAHPVLSALPTTDVVVSYCHRTAAIGDPYLSLIGKQIGYDPTRNQDGSLTVAVNALANGFGSEWGLSLTAGKRSDSTATDGSSHDYGATIGQTLFGAQAYLHVFSFTGTSVTITIEDSTDDAVFATLATFTAVSSAPTSERIQTGRTETVDRYVRVATSGTFSECTFAVGFTKNETSIDF